MAGQFGINNMVRDWYMKSYPKDVMRHQVNKDVTFRDVVECLNRNQNPMNMIGTHDPLVRDRIFGKVAVLSNVSFDVVNNKWLLKSEAPDVPMKAMPSRGLGQGFV